ncbi:esterase 1 [Russula dissimulans]|nr:esterase 1 [Russula dissimulans]
MWKFWILTTLPLVFAAWKPRHHHARQAQTRVQLGGTTIIGKGISSNVDFFGGIPFAEPPVGNLRLFPPQPKYSLDPLQLFDARHYGLGCFQAFSPNVDMSEDCLTLNIFRPYSTSKLSFLPVMVWIYGGGFYGGTSSTYDGTSLVEQSVARGTPIIFVSMNYRIAALGFPQGFEAEKQGILNLGLRDQKVALEWVQRNIASFGGDPRKVTVSGESAGALSASYHYLNEDFATLARAAIFQSGTASTLPIFNASHGTHSWHLFLSKTPCATVSPDSTISCLRSANMTSSDLAAAINAAMAIEKFPFRPVLDGPDGILSDYPAKRLSSGVGGQVPFMAGTTLDEGTLFIPKHMQLGDIPTWLNTNFTPCPSGPAVLKNKMDELISLYPDDPSLGSPFGTGNQTFGTGKGYKRASAMYGDLLFQAPRRFLSQMACVPSFAYLFTDPQADPALGVYHSSELPYLFGNLAKDGSSSMGPLSYRMRDYWISFIVSLNPNDGMGTNSRFRYVSIFILPLIRAFRTSLGDQILQLNSDNTQMISDTYRANSIDYMMNMSAVLSW